MILVIHSPVVISQSPLPVSLLLLHFWKTVDDTQMDVAQHLCDYLKPEEVVVEAWKASVMGFFTTADGCSFADKWHNI
jgi:hypothetical protein